MTKELNILDQMEEIRQRAAENPGKYPIDYTIRLLSAIVAESCGYEGRTEWTTELKESAESQYHKRYYGGAGQFHI